MPLVTSALLARQGWYPSNNIFVNPEINAVVDAGKSL